nr:alkylmercury lyase [Mycobacterium gordonae]
MRVEHLSSPGCPNAAASRALLTECLEALGLTASLVERVGAFPSPSVLVDGADVMSPDQPPTGECCRLDVPTRGAIVAALQRAADRR